MRILLTPKQLDEYRNIDNNLAHILIDVLGVWPSHEMLVTDIHRSREEDSALGGSGIHTVGPPYRAMDIRTRSLGIESEDKASLVARIANEKWVYDPRRERLKVAVYFDGRAHGSGPHLHLQVHPHTKRR